MNKKITIILNGKKAGLESLRDDIASFRKKVNNVDIRVTYEFGDVERFLLEAIENNSFRIIIGGGDGTVNEIVNAMAKIKKEDRPELAILPLGTANDFATACDIPTNSLEALYYAEREDSVPVDIVQVNDRYFINMATAGFGAQVTADTPVELKNFLGGGAYTITGVLNAMNFVPFKNKIFTEENDAKQQDFVVAAICNGRQAGGGQVLAPNAFINDGLLDVVGISNFTLLDIPQVVNELAFPSENGKFIRYKQLSWIKSVSDKPIPVNLDGEPLNSSTLDFKIIPLAINLVLAKDCPCIK